MLTLSGTGLFGCVTSGSICVIESNSYKGRLEKCDSPKEEILRFYKAFNIAKSELLQISLSSKSPEREIFLSQIAMLSDVDFLSKIEDTINKEHVTAEYAVAKVADIFAIQLENSKSNATIAKSLDVYDIAQRIETSLSKKSIPKTTLSKKSIVMANWLTASDLVELDKTKIAGLILGGITIYSHTAIVAENLGIPTILVDAIENIESYNNNRCILDCDNGTIYLNPDKDTEKSVLHRSQKSAPTEKISTKINIFANISFPDDVNLAKKMNADGIGLMRSEFLFMNRETSPSEEEQFECYRTVCEKLRGKPTVIRTLDLDSDKMPECFSGNSTLGMRGIQFCLANPEIFKTQLRAILRASVYGNVMVMYPMISTLSELQQAKEIFAQVQTELNLAKIPQGVMIETPSAALISDILAENADFFSIGTNDLTQYTLAQDRHSVTFNPSDDAVFRLIELTARNANAKGIPVSICGELAHDTSLTKRFVDIGITALSVAPVYIEKLKSMF